MTHRPYGVQYNPLRSACSGLRRIHYRCIQQVVQLLSALRAAFLGAQRQLSRYRTTEVGQGTVEYALLLLGAAAIALLLVAWVARTDLIGRLFDTVVGKILGRA